MTTTSTIKTGIAEKIYQSFPSGTYCLPALLRVLEVVETTEVETASIECKLTPRLLVNPDFVAEHASTPEKLVVLVLHELHHLLLGHTRLYPRPTPLDNLAFDAVINATLSRLFPEREYLAMFTDFYDEAELLACFLRPATGWTPDGEAVCPPALCGDDPSLSHLRQVHAALYSTVGATYDEVRDALGKALWLARGKPTEAVPLEALPPLLGDHSDEASRRSSSSGDLEGRAPALLTAVREIVERWPPPPSPIVGRSASEFLQSFHIAPPTVPPSERLRRLVRRIAGEGKEDTAHRRTQVASPVWSAVPQANRRSVVLRALGATPLLYETTLTRPRRRNAGERVHVYVDVSGSVSKLIPTLYGVILSSKKYVHPVVHTFSTVVADLSLEELRSGVVQTTTGTEISCIADHARRNRIKRALIITDGFTGYPNETDRATLSAMRIGVALTPGGSNRSDLEGVVTEWTTLDPIDPSDNESLDLLATR